MQKLMNVMVERVLAKHNVTKDTVDISQEEKDRIREVVENIQTEVNDFLDNQTTTVTDEESSEDEENES
ncbi:spore coat protein W [Natribacillus halophilus]|uniref:Spore coat protein W n=2 Tax=Natribacillus halophilus TaxID=549003 RepID=A0A1G8JLP9_9BACI|nr:spore coat protein W [Natribacillus halophilus]